MGRGITVQNLGTQMSELIFNGQEHNSGTIVTCRAVNTNNVLDGFTSELVEVIIYGKHTVAMQQAMQSLMYTHRSSATPH